MQQFIPFEDDWDALEQLRPEALIPYRVGLVSTHGPLAAQAPEAHRPVQVVVVIPVSPEKSA